MTTRDRVIQAFWKVEGVTYFSHEEPFHLTNFIDGMAWLGVLAGAARIAKDPEVEGLCVAWLNTLSQVGPDARNFSPRNLDDSWVPSESIPGLWYKPKPQSFAGPAALHWAYSLDVPVEVENIPAPYTYAQLLCWVADWYGKAVKHFEFLRQHINSLMFAHLLLRKRPPNSLIFAAKDNPLYSYLFGIPCNAVYSDRAGAWPAKNVWGAGEKDQVYTPVCQLAAEYLQSSLVK